MITTETYGCDKHGEDAYQGCAMCDLEALRTDYALLSDDYKQLVLDKESLRSRLAEAKALLTEARDDVVECLNREVTKGHDNTLAIEHYRAQLRRIDAHLSREKP